MGPEKVCWTLKSDQNVEVAESRSWEFQLGGDGRWRLQIISTKQWGAGVGEQRCPVPKLGMQGTIGAGTQGGTGVFLHAPQGCLYPK